MPIGSSVSCRRLRSQGPLFGRDSNVLAYWLAHAEGFEVATRNRRRGQVEQVLVDPARGRAAALVVRPSARIPLRRRRIVAAGAVVAVDPLQRRFHLTSPRRRPRPVREPRATVSRPIGPRVALLVRRSWATLDRTGRVLWSSLVAADAWLRPRLDEWERSATSVLGLRRPEG